MSSSLATTDRVLGGPLHYPEILPVRGDIVEAAGHRARCRRIWRREPGIKVPAASFLGRVPPPPTIEGKRKSAKPVESRSTCLARRQAQESAVTGFPAAKAPGSHQNAGGSFLKPSTLLPTLTRTQFRFGTSLSSPDGPSTIRLWSELLTRR